MKEDGAIWRGADAREAVALRDIREASLKLRTQWREGLRVACAAAAHLAD